MVVDIGNLEKIIKSAPVQKATLKKVALKKAGRPPKPNMKTFLFKIDGTTHARFSKKAASKGLNKSAAVNMLMLEWLAKED